MPPIPFPRDARPTRRRAPSDRRLARVLVCVTIVAMTIPVAISTREHHRRAAAARAPARATAWGAAPGAIRDRTRAGQATAGIQPGRPGAARSAPEQPDRGDGFTRAEDGITRGRRTERQIALVFTGHEFAEGGDTILDALQARGAKASFFLTGVFLRTPAHGPLVQRMVRAGHFVGPHSDQHLLLCPWEGPKRSLVTREQFDADVRANLRALEPHGIDASKVTFFLPSYEWYNAEHAAWSRALGLTLINFTPGTRSNADYTEEGTKQFVSSETIFNSILRKEEQDPDGLKGFILLLHVGAGQKRTDKMAARFAPLLEALTARGYTFVRIDDLLAGAAPAAR